MPIYQQGSGRLGAGAATNPANGQAAQPAAAPSSGAALGGLTAGVGGSDQRAAANRRTGRGLGRQAMDAARDFYVRDDRYSRNVGDQATPEDPKVYSNDPSQVGADPIPLSQAQKPAPPPPAPAPMAPAAVSPTFVSQPVAAPAPAPRTSVSLDATSPGQVRSEAGVTAPSNPVAGVRSDLTSGNMSGRLGTPALGTPPPPPAPSGLSGPALVNDVRTDASSGNLSAALPQPAPTQMLQQSNPDVSGFLSAQRRGLLR
jgi:hypothetical protein